MHVKASMSLVAIKSTVAQGWSITSLNNNLKKKYYPLIFFPQYSQQPFNHEWNERPLY